MSHYTKKLQRTSANLITAAQLLVSYLTHHGTIERYHELHYQLRERTSEHAWQEHLWKERIKNRKEAEKTKKQKASKSKKKK